MDDASAIEHTTEIVAAFLSNNLMSPNDLPAFISTVHKTLVAINRGEPGPEAREAPAVSPRRSVQPDHLVCLEDGQRFKSLKRHLRTKHNLTPDHYRDKWGLGGDYPMVAENYSAARSALAKSIGLGTRGRTSPVTPHLRRKPAARGSASRH
jgi:predicted transcriptional regulator